MDPDDRRKDVALDIDVSVLWMSMVLSLPLTSKLVVKAKGR